ncbi:mannitol dehydrogenase family protein [Microbacterium sp. HD4P20]|uniref:mannitol dehydrogenase family protein n=1 Tax=Microbacterium sp. HD4P20 TaxID=2864874 RepID=UPI001C63F2B2|nr:mannitol dehydrogenase family protein [Microbacterium sp. HD4P20]MCP2637949.1 mannitol dehydrogenase family protein [Microbacterium sp. HD4P20]
MSLQTLPRLTRTELTRAGRAAAAPPVRIVHLGAGAFHRAHQAWFTAHATDAAAWGIAAFTGRHDTVARQLAPQDGLFTLVERGPETDRFEVVPTIAEVHPASDAARFAARMAAPATAVVTLTVTEAGYHQRPDGTLDLHDPAVRHDIQALRDERYAAVRTPTGRLLVGLEARRLAGAPPLTVVPCDNVPANGARLHAAVLTLAKRTGLEAALARTAFVTTSVDRITPHTTEDDRVAVADATGWRDEGAVVAEPFADWTLSGDFAGERPAWEGAGARFVADIEPYERRKLLLLNGGHLALAFGGLLRGHTTVAQAMADERCRRDLDAFWDEAARAAGSVDTRDYRAALVRRFENGRIEHRLTQITVDTVTKIRMRIVPVLAHARAEGRSGAGALAVVRAWADGIRSERIDDETDAAAALARLLEGTDPGLAADLAGAVSARS